MRIAGIAIVAWLAAMIVTQLAGVVVFREQPSAADLMGMTTITFVASALLVLSCYLPGLWLLRRRYNRRLTTMQAAIAASIGLNIPAFLILAFMASRADVFAPGEALWFASKFLLFGLAFGAGYALYGQPTAAPASK